MIALSQSAAFEMPLWHSEERIDRRAKQCDFIATGNRRVVVTNCLRVVVVMSNPSHSACDRCGACCKTFPVLVSIGDARREPRITCETLELPEWQRTEEWRYRLHPLPFLQGCCFLQEDNLCAVYDTRPDPCRRFQAGSPECAEARSRVGLSPLD